MARTNRMAWLDSAPAEVLFITGGELMSPVYPQPGYTAADQWAYCSSYDTGFASTDELLNTKFISTAQSSDEIIDARDEIVARIYKNIFRARQIEKERQALATAINNLSFPQQVDQQG